MRFRCPVALTPSCLSSLSVWVNRKCVWIARFELKTGDAVEVPQKVIEGARRQGAVPAAAPAAAAPTGARRHVRVLWQDADYLVCDKPAGLLSCDDPKSVESILRVQEGIPTLEAVHRLDRDTTGCLMFAKSHAALQAAVEVFKTHKVVKIYNAVVAGCFRFPHQVVDTPLDGQSAVSRITREAAGSDASFLRVRIETGRTNQIRRHLSSIRYPIVGDRVFGLKNARDPRLMQVARCMLHAATLEMPHPRVPKEQIKTHAPLPADFRAALKLFGMGK